MPVSNEQIVAMAAAAIAEELQEKRSEYSGTFCKPDTIEACKI